MSGDDVELGLKDEYGNNIELRLEENLKENEKIEDSQYIIPKDWRIIGTMNTFDKTSLYEMSYAFMRRFAFIPVGIPRSIDNQLVKNLVKIWELNLNAKDIENIVDLWNIINNYRKIGPALIEDIAKFIALDGDYTSAIAIYLLPQLEGLFDEEIDKLYKELTKLAFIKDQERLKSSVQDFFNKDLGAD